jgi:predicted nucleic acid-binding protein
MKSGNLGPEEKWSTGILLDSNIFLELELAEEHADACRRLLERVRDGKVKGYITDFHVDSIVLVMESYGKSWKDLLTFLVSLLKYKGLRICRLDHGDRIAAVQFMRDFDLGFDDALAIQALKKLSLDTIVSYDRHFDKVSGVKRITPEELVG